MKEEQVIEVRSIEDLQKIRENPNAKYKLMNDIIVEVAKK